MSRRRPVFPLILSAPSGAGKTTLARALLERFPGEVAFSISATTRPPRGEERDGVDYHFVAEPEFRRMAAAGDLLEWAEVHGRLYGTPRINALTAAAVDRHLLLDIDIQGAEQVRMRLPEAVSVFVLPPSAEVLRERLLGRRTESAAAAARRLQAATRELEAAPRFDYIVVNDDLERAVNAVGAILRAERLRSERDPGLTARVTQIAAALRSGLGGGDSQDVTSISPEHGIQQ